MVRCRESSCLRTLNIVQRAWPARRRAGALGLAADVPTPSPLPVRGRCQRRRSERGPVADLPSGRGEPGPRVLVDMEDSLSGPSRLRYASSSSPWLLYRQGSARLGPSAPSGTGRPCHSGSESCQWPQVAVDWPGASSESPRPHPSLHRDWARLDYRALHLHRDLACLCDSDIRTVTV